jgi:hypothetical protein
LTLKFEFVLHGNKSRCPLFSTTPSVRSHDFCIFSRSCGFLVQDNFRILRHLRAQPAVRTRASQKNALFGFDLRRIRSKLSSFSVRFQCAFLYFQ